MLATLSRIAEGISQNLYGQILSKEAFTDHITSDFEILINNERGIVLRQQNVRLIPEVCIIGKIV